MPIVDGRVVAVQLIPDINFRAIHYRYRHCSSCHRDWPAQYGSCPQCAQWLGDKPLERTEWQVVPSAADGSEPSSYALIGGFVVIFRLVTAARPAGSMRTAAASVVREMMEAVAAGSICGIADQGWLIYSKEGLRPAFRIASDVADHISSAGPRLQAELHHCGELRWGVWGDQYLVAVDSAGCPVPAEDTAAAIFDFEPDNMFSCSELAYRANRPWQHFLGVSHRLLDGRDVLAYRPVGPKRPSALDHTEAEALGPFVGRERELESIEHCWSKQQPGRRLAILAEAGSGKTRLMREWLAKRPDLRTARATFSLFGGTIDAFVAQLVKLPPDRLDRSVLKARLLNHIEEACIDVLVIDDLHWADDGDIEFLEELLAEQRLGPLFVILVARPSGRDRVERLAPSDVLALQPLPREASVELATRLIPAAAVAAIAWERSNGNPLFLEHFAQWAAETAFSGGDGGPRNLHQLIAARIEHLAQVQLKDIQTRLRRSDKWERREIYDELQDLELEIGRWLDRLETGDYADRIEVTHYLIQLEQFDFELVSSSHMAGRPRSRSSRLREAIDRLLLGSGVQILDDLRQRAATSSPGSVEAHQIVREARRAGDALITAFDWLLAGAFYELSLSLDNTTQAQLAIQLEICRQHNRFQVTDEEVWQAATAIDVNRRPNLGPLELPYAWIKLATEQPPPQTLYQNALTAASAINDPALAKWVECRMCRE